MILASIYDTAIDKLHSYIDWVIRVLAGITVILTGIDIGHFLPAIISALATVAALVFKKLDMDRRYRDYVREEKERTKKIDDYLQNARKELASVNVKVVRDVDKALNEGDKVKIDDDDTDVEE